MTLEEMTTRLYTHHLIANHETLERAFKIALTEAKFFERQMQRFREERAKEHTTMHPPITIPEGPKRVSEKRDKSLFEYVFGGSDD